MKLTTLIFIIVGTMSSALAQNVENDELKLKETTNKIEYVDILNQLSEKYSLLDQKKANMYSTQAMRLADSIKYKKGLADAYYARSLVSRENYNYYQELEYALASLKIYEELKNSESLARTYNAIGQVHFQQFDFKLSRLYFDKAIAAFRLVNNLAGQAKVLRRLGNIKLLTQEYDSAREFYESSLALEKELKNEIGIAGCLNNMGVVLYETKRYDEALVYHFQALNIETETNIFDRIPSSHHNIGRVFLAQNRLAEALEHSELGLRIAKKLRIIPSLIEMYLLRSEIYSRQGNHKEALFSMNRHLTLRDSIRENETRLKVAQLEALLSNKKAALLEREQAASEYAGKLSRSRLSEAILVFSLVMTFGALIIILLYLRNLRSRKKIGEKELELANTQRKLTEYKLAAIHSQMNPHFIFNALNSIQSSIVANDNGTAYKYLSKFSKLLRSTLDHPHKRYHSLKNEIRLLELYLQLEQLRFMNDFHYEIDIEEGLDMENTMIPCMLIQPLAENAFKHGLATKIGYKKISIRIYTEGESICYAIEDNGIGREKSRQLNLLRQEEQTSWGTQLVISKLDIANSGALLEIIDLYDKENNPAGTRALIRIAQSEHIPIPDKRVMF